MTPSQTAALQAQIDSLGDRMASGFDEIKSLLISIEERTRLLETSEAGYQPLANSRIDAVVLKIADHETRLATKSQQINTLDKQVAKLVGMYNFFIFVGSAFGLSLISLIWALITGHAQVVFK
jgi:uncharacterized protein involved in exopolysaccharide biosynthesis